MLKVVEAFSGIGSQAKALSILGEDYEISNTIEWDISAFYAYDVIHNGKQDLSSYDNMSKDSLIMRLSEFTLSTNGKEPISKKVLASWPLISLKRVLCAIERTNNLCSITDVKENMLPKKIDLLTYSFPCQDLSTCGAWHGNTSGINRNANNRSGMLWEVERILLERNSSKSRLPQFLLMENVVNINSSAHIANFREWQSTLESLGYINQVYNLDASNFGIPQIRKRTYMLSILAPKAKRKRVIKYLEHNNLEEYTVSENESLIKEMSLKDILKVDYSNITYKNEAIICNRNDTPSRKKIYEGNEIVFDGKNNYRRYVNTLTTKQDRNPNAGILEFPIHDVGKSKYRNLTPRECFLLMGFEERDYEAVINNDFMVNKTRNFYRRERLEKIAGNSIVVNVLVKIFEQVIEIRKFL